MTDQPPPPPPSRVKTANPWMRIVRDVTDLAVLGLIVATLMVWLGRFWWVADLFSHFAVYYAVASLGVLVLAWSMRRRRAAVIALVLFVVHAWTVLPSFNPLKIAAVAPGPQIRLAQVNVLHKNRDRASLLNFIRQCDADLIFVQELDPWWDHVLREADVPYRMLISQPEQGPFGIGMLVHESFENNATSEIESTKLLGQDERFDRPSIEATLLLDGRRMKVLSIHPPPPTRGVFAAQRDTILRRAKQWADAQTDPHAIIGDLNTTPWSHAFSILTHDGQLRSTLDGRGNQGSWPTHLPMPWLLPIDHCLVSDGLTSIARKTGPFIGSDHLPLTVTLACQTR